MQHQRLQPETSDGHGEQGLSSCPDKIRLLAVTGLQDTAAVVLMLRPLRVTAFMSILPVSHSRPASISSTFCLNISQVSPAPSMSSESRPMPVLGSSDRPRWYCAVSRASLAVDRYVAAAAHHEYPGGPVSRWEPFLTNLSGMSAPRFRSMPGGAGGHPLRPVGPHLSPGHQHRRRRGAQRRRPHAAGRQARPRRLRARPSLAPPRAAQDPGITIKKDTPFVRLN